MGTNEDNRIKKNQMANIINGVGIPTTLKHLRACMDVPETDYGRNELERRIKGLIAEAKEIESDDNFVVDENEYFDYFTENHWEKLRKIIVDCTVCFDMDLYILHMGRLLEYDYTKAKAASWVKTDVKFLAHLMRENSQSHRKKAMTYAKEELKGKKVIDLSPVPDPESPKEPTDSECPQICNVTSEEFRNITTNSKSRQKKYEERLERIDEEIALENIVRTLILKDFYEVCMYPRLAQSLVTNLKKQIKDENNITEEEFKVIEGAIRQNIRFIDIDKLLTTFAERVRYSIIPEDNDGIIQTGKLEVEELEQCITIIQATEKLIKDKNATVKTVIGSQDPNEDRSNSENEVTINDILLYMEDLRSRCVAGIYYSAEDYVKLRGEIIEGKIDLSTINLAEFEKFNFTPNELSSLQNNNQNALSYLISNNILSQEEANAQINAQNEFSDEQLMKFVSSGLINRTQLLNLYMQGKVNIENMLHIKLNSDEDLLKRLGFICQDENGNIIDGLVNPKELVNLYVDPARNAEFEKYRKLYKLLVMDDTPEETRQKRENENDKKILEEIDIKIEKRRTLAGEKIIDELSINESIQDDKELKEYLFDLYIKGIITLENLIEYGMIDKTEEDKKTFQEMYVSGKLKPSDAKRLYKQRILTDEFLISVYANEEISLSDRLLLLTGTFSNVMDEEEVKKRNYFFGCIPDLLEKSSKKNTLAIKSDPETSKLHTKQKKVGNTVPKSDEEKKKVTDPFIRMSLLEKLDSDYVAEFLDDGTLKIYLPSYGKYIFEPMFDKKMNAKTGAATYIVTEEVYNTNKEQFIIRKKKIDGKEEKTSLSITNLAEFNRQHEEGIKKIIHTGWGNAIMKYFGIEESKRYTEEEKRIIRQLAKMVEESKKEIEER